MFVYRQEGNMFAWPSVSTTPVVAFLFVASWIMTPGLSVAQDGPPDEELARQQKVVERFFTVLEKNPRRGTALDKIYGFHVESGTLDQLVGRYQEKAKDTKDGMAWMILGLIESQRGRDAAAVEAFTKAAAASPKDAMPSYYLGQSLVLVGQPDQAVAAFEEAISRKPNQNDLLEIFQALGRVHQRAQRSKEALEVWARLEKLFPGDARVQEQIAASLVEEGQHAQALPRYEALVKLTKDDYRKSVYRIEAAEIKVKLNRSQEAIAELEKLLATLNPTSWLHREVRRKIEEVYLRSDDQSGLATYYEGWLQKNPEDVDAMARLARLLARQARVPEAQAWLDKALKLAPSRKELRQSFIQQLVEDQRYTDAIAQYEVLDKAEPNNPDTLREWGKMILRDTTISKEERLKKAEVIWRRLLAARPKDPLIATQVADLFRHAEMVQPALDLYQKAVELAPEQAQYLEYLGEYYHQLKRTDEAQATWRKSIEGSKRNATSLSRLAEVLASFGYLPQAIPEIQAACELDPKDVSLHLKAADLLTKAEKYDDALAALAKCEKLSQNTEESEAALAAQLKIYQLEDSLQKRAEDLAAQIADSKPSAKQLFLLARYYEALRRYPDATRAIDASLKLAPQDIPALASAARIYENAGELLTAADLNRKLSVVDRRGRSDYLKYVAQLETQLGRTEEALKAGKELIASAPGNTENYEFYANLCFRLGQSDEGLQSLRRAMRVSPNDPKLILVLAEALAGQYRTDEAIQLYWQAFDKSPSLDDRLAQIQKLTDLYSQTNHLDKLLERLERMRRDADDKRESTICIAQAYSSAADFGMARQELESLISDSSRDTQLLSQLSKLSSTEGDLTSAIKYQEQLARIAPGPETEYPLATLLAQSGAAQESAAILVRLTAKEEDPEKLLRNLDSMLASGQHETALLIIETKLREEPKNWELLYREGVATAKTNLEGAAARFRAILDLPNEDNDWCAAEKNRLAKAARGKTAPTAARVDFDSQRVAYATQIRVAAGLLPEEMYYGQRQASSWSPFNYGQARFASIAWLYRSAQEAKKKEEFVANYQKAIEDPKGTPRVIWDSIYAILVQTTDTSSSANDPRVLGAAKNLAAQGDMPGQYLLFQSLLNRPQARNSSGSASDSLPPLPAADLDLALASFRSIVARSRVLNPGQPAMNLSLASLIMTELRRAGRNEEEAKILQDFLAQVSTPDQLAPAISMVAGRDDLAGTRELFEKWSHASLQTTKPPTQSNYTVASAIGQLMGVKGAEKKDTEVTALLDTYLDYNAARSTLERRKSAGRPKRTTATRNYLTLYYGKNGRTNSPLTFPVPNEYYDVSAIQLLRNAYEIAQRNDVVSDLQKHLKERLAKSATGDKIYEQLAVAYVYSWTDDKEVALTELSAAAELVPQDWQMRIDVARLHSEMQNFDEALRVVDTIAPLDQDAMREREIMAMNLAVRLGEHARATQAAERLFGLRLDAEMQIQLAGQMRRLGMNEQSEAVLSRAQRQAGRQLSTMVTLMSAHQADGKTDVAVQIAYQILRRSRPQLAPTSRYVSTSSDAGARTAALRVMAASGKLKEMVAAAEEQFKRAPQSPQLAAMLSEYYEAAGEKDKALALEAGMVEQKKEDANLRYRYAQKLQAAGKFSEACDQYKIVFKQQPRLLSNDYYQIPQVFRQAKKEAELTQLLGEIDLQQLGQYHYVIDFISSLLQNPDQRPAAMALLKKAMDAFPNQRSYMLTSFYNDDAWELPELYELGKQALIPRPAEVQSDRWIGLSQINSYSSDGTAYSVFGRVVKAAAKKNDLPKLREDLAKGIEAQPAWKAGPLMLATIDARLGNVDAARLVLDEAMKAKAVGDFPMEARWLVGLELESNEAMRETVLKLYEGAMREGSEVSMRNGFQYSPGPRLLKIYAEAKRFDDAKKLMIKAEKVPEDSSSNAGYRAYQLAENRLGLANQYEQMQAAADALRLYRDILTNPSMSPDAFQQYAGNAEYIRRQARAGLTRITKDLTSKKPSELVAAVLTPTEVPGKPILDLMVGVQTETDGLSKMDSQLVATIGSKSLSGEGVQVVASQVRDLAEKHPTDLNVKIVAALMAIRRGDVEETKTTLAGLKALVDQSPLEEMQGSQRANARQREAAFKQVALGLVADECLKSEGLKAEGEFFFARALEAANRQVDTQYRVALLSERLRGDLKSGNKDAAKERLESMLAIALTRPQVKKPAAPAVSPGKVPGVPNSPGVPNNAGVTKTPSNNVAPSTLSQFKLAMSISNLAVQQGFGELAGKGVRESLAGGLPVTDANPSTDRAASQRMVIRGEASNENTEITRAVTTELSRLSAAWREKSLPPQEMYEVLSSIVFPPARPDEIFLYEEPLSDWKNARSLGREIARWSVAAKKEDDLRQRIASRATRPNSALAGQVLTAFLAVESKAYDQVAASLTAMVQTLNAQPRPEAAATASHAAAVAFAVPELQESALPLMQAVTKGIAPSNSSNEGHVNLLAQYYTAKRMIPDLKSLYEAHLERKLPHYAQYAGNSDYGTYLQRNDLSNTVVMVAPARDVSLTLDFLGRLADLPIPKEYGDMSMEVPMWHVAMQVRGMPAQERYALLRDWTLPTEKRRTLRFVSSFISGQQPLEVLLLSDASAAKPEEALVSNFAMLVSAAKEAGKLDELQASVDAAVQEKMIHAPALAAMVALAREDQSAVAKVQAFVNATRERAKGLPTSPLANRVDRYSRIEIMGDDAIVAFAAMQSDKGREQGQKLARVVLQERRSLYQAVPHASRLVALDALHGLNAEDGRSALSPGLRYWVPQTPPQHVAGVGGIPMWWTAHGGHVTHITGSSYDHLFFKYPLVGTFEFSFEAHTYDLSQGEIAYGGLVSNPQMWFSNVTIFPVSQHETVTRGATVESMNNWNRYSVKVSPQSIRFYSNNHLVYEETDPSRTSPWLHLVSLNERRSDFRKLKLTGSLEVSRQVELVHGDRMEGWISSDSAKMPSRLTLREPALPIQTQERYQREEDTRPLQWYAQEGVLWGAVDAGKSGTSHLYYHRPLLSGETIRYQFLATEGKACIHPTLGRFAFVFEPAGVQLQWTSTPSSQQLFGLAMKSTIDEPNNRRGPAELPLKPNAWNDVQLSLEGDVARLMLNGELVYERTMEPANSSFFGLLHHRDRGTAQVRNIVLTGDWPEKLSAADLDNLLAPASTDESPQLRKARHELVREEELVEDAYDVWQQAQSLSPEARYQMAANWVLPGADHPTFRLQSGFKSTQLAAPAFELVRTAAELKRLDELDSAVKDGGAKVDGSERDVLALRTLIAINRPDDKAATAYLKVMEESLKTLDPYTPEYLRFAEFVVADAALSRPALRRQALALAEILVEQQQSQAQASDWEKRVCALRAHARLLNVSPAAELSFQSPKGLTQWTPISFPTAEFRGKKFSLPIWSFEKGRISFHNGNGSDSLYFRSPLQGDFEVHFRLTTAKGQEIRMMYDALATDLSQGGGLSTLRVPLARAGLQLPLSEKLPGWGDVVDCKLVVKGGEYKLLVGDKEISSQRLGTNSDPWLAIQSSNQQAEGRVENVRIVGSPTVPEVLKLSEAPTLSSWRADYYGETIDDTTATWLKDKNEIVGKRFESAPNSHRESLLTYHRPLLEDGEIEYEFYYESGKTLVHPAIGRYAFLLNEERVRLHQLTDAAFERNGLTPDNEAPLSGSAKKFKLADGDWNRVKIALTGDTMTISIGGETIGQHTLQQGEPRHFGLFRYSDATEARVRNVTYEGKWSQQIPTLEQQELASR
jgi:tetratricopeptide (TPR) repeat protein